MEKDILSSGFIGEDIPVDQEDGVVAEDFYVSASGYSRLHLCRRHGKLHILKSLQPLYAQQDFYRQLLRKEFHIGYQLEHLHICRTLGWEKQEKLGDCIVLEYIDGMTLKSFMEQGRLTPLLARKLIKEICEALQYIHSKQVIHRDLKPANILVTHNGHNVKLIDFGLSDRDDYDVLKLPAGTRKYLAPELLASGTPWDNRIDIYSLGVIIEEMAGLLKDRQLLRIARKCTQIDPAKRYASAAEIVTVLKQKNDRPVLKYAAAFLFLSVCLGGYVYYPWKTGGGLEEKPFFPVYTNTSISTYSQQFLMNECNRLNQSYRFRPAGLSVTEDSLRLLKGLRQLLDKEFPLPEMKESSEYRRRREDIRKIVARQMKSGR